MSGSPFSRLPIRHKLVTMIMATSAAVLLLASGGYLATDYYQSRTNLLRDLTAQARVILENSTAAIEFLDRPAAQETLQTLQSNTHIRNACLYNGAGRLFAEYASPGAATGCPERPEPDSYRFVSGRLEHSSGVELKGQRAASLFLRSDLEILQSRLRVQVMIVALLLIVALGVALLMSSRLHSLVSEPVAELARTATEVSSRGDYSIRATRTTEDELGVLVDAFNRMLERIQLREAELSKANEDLRQANRLKDEFLATLSHELRTPLNAILGWTRLLRSNAVPAAAIDRALEKVERNAQVQSRLVEDMLDVSRIASGKLRLDVRAFDLVALITTAIESIRPTAEARGVRIDRRFQSSSLPTAGDPDRLQQVVWNLLSNAVKFTPAGGEVTVGLRRDGEFDELTVTDTGMGIDPAFLPDVFDSFRQADASSTRSHGGLGLGLSIVKHLVDLHAGSVHASSAGPGRGATFSVRLPARTLERSREESPPAGELPVGPSLTGHLTGVRIVVVDDDPDTRELIVSVLEVAGAEVRGAASADEGFHACHDMRPDVLVSDIAMPVRDGFGLMQQLDMLGPDAPRVRIALTALAGPHDRERAAAAGFQRHVAKPFEAQMLVQTIRELLAEQDVQKRTRSIS